LNGRLRRAWTIAGCDAVKNLFKAFAFFDGVARTLADFLALGYQFLRVPDQSACG